ncbi:pyrroline-5-carboxylate reductase [Jeotgalibacillus proteolyticus]|uniref:Pyrroline-5-carboxylate reductase n=1 Tax=Jeotgalibacillus proteolyticus TaxID=2082395 RepID=A0A2S5GE58_9BACL|nr:pyrroline-5-carboxylate reductase [Jeotgalibacillus proteolyticus]PPA71332.1 pyrroline-5-carboxylate reductase [Jeotgalibacillus proteolyticus]
MKIVFIGAGSMAEAMIQGLVQAPLLKGGELWVTNRSDTSRLEGIKDLYNVQISYDLPSLFQGTEVIVLAMKPKDAKEALLSIQPYISEGQLIISVLAGLSIEFIEGKLRKGQPIARAMPNTSATIQQSATGVAFNDYVSDGQKNIALSVLEAIGTVTVVEENKLDLVTGLSGSGPAYIYYIVEAMEQAAVELGLPQAEAKPFILQTLAGASNMLLTTNKSPQSLRKAITSEGGTTEAGVKKLEQHHVKEAFKACIKEATEHSGRLRNQFEQFDNE